MSNPKPESCVDCPLYSTHWGGSAFGWINMDGLGRKGVLIVGEAGGEAEEEAGKPFVGKAGHYTWGNLKRVGLDRDDFYIVNVLSCRPPNNKLVGMPYEQAAIDKCRPNLKSAVEDYRTNVRARGFTPTILTFGKTAFKQIMGLNDKVHATLLKLDYLCYPFWSEPYQCWVVAADHPSYLMRGNHHLVSIFQFAAKQAVEIAEHGFSYARATYYEDPTPQALKTWVDGYIRALEADPDNTYLAYDIETPMKQKANEEDVAKEDDPDYTILRISFAYKPHEAVSVPWDTPYLNEIARALATSGSKVGWNNENYDNPRILPHMPINGDIIDAMLGWHVLNSALPKGLGFVAPFYAKKTGMWKHLADAKPAFYSAKDSDMQLQCWLGIKEDLINNNLWDVFHNHIIRMNRVFTYMSQQGVLRDEALRSQSEAELAGVLIDIQREIEAVIPLEARDLKIFKKEPKDTEGMIQVPGERVAKVCSICGMLDVTAAHTRSIGKKKLKDGALENPCISAPIHKETVATLLWAQPLPFKISNTGLQRYQKAVKHRPILDPKTKRVTFDDKALMRLIKKYPNDPLYSLIGKFRKAQKLLSTYVGITQPDGVVRGGLKVDKNFVIHTTFTRNPSTLRSAAQNPNLQNLPR